MSLTIEQIARAFSAHRFEEAAPYLRDDVQWHQIGGESLTGRDAVLARCRESAAYLAGVATTFERFRAVVDTDSVAIDTLATYVEGDGASTAIASCDFYDFVDGNVAAITSYTVDVTEER